MNYQLLQGDCLQTMRTLPAESVHVCITSPPYFGLRSYLHNEHDDKHMEIGSEPTVEAYVARLVDVFREVRRVLHPTGVVFLNLGDSYNGSGGAGGDYGPGGLKEGQPKYPGRNVNGLKPKDLCMIPARVAIALQDDGWWLRSAITWCKTNPMPESVTDRPTSATEMVFMLAKNESYFYDNVAIAEPASQPPGIPRRTGQQKATELGAYRGMYADTPTSGLGTNQGAGTRNRRNWWVVNSEPYPGSHFAVMPTKLVEPMVLAGTSAYGCCAKCLAPYERVTERTREHGLADTSFPKTDGLDAHNGHKRLHQRVKAARAAGEPHDNPLGGTVTTGWAATCTCAADVIPCTVLDCFNGAATVGVVATKFGRRYIGCELSQDYINLSRTRLEQVQPMLMDVTS